MFLFISFFFENNFTFRMFLSNVKVGCFCNVWNCLLKCQATRSHWTCANSQPSRIVNVVHFSSLFANGSRRIAIIRCNFNTRVVVDGKTVLQRREIKSAPFCVNWLLIKQLAFRMFWKVNLLYKWHHCRIVLRYHDKSSHGLN